MKISIAKVSELGSSEIAIWHKLQDEEQDYKSPFLSYEWAKIVYEAREDARTAIIEDNNQIIGFLSVQGGGNDIGYGLGAPICDRDGLIIKTGYHVDARELLMAFKLKRIDLSNYIGTSYTHDADYNGYYKHCHNNLVCDLVEFNRWLSAASKKSSSNLKNIARIKKKIAKDGHELRFETYSKDETAFHKLIELKSAQYAATRQTDIFQSAWVRDVLHKSFLADTKYLKGELSILFIDDKIAASGFSIGGTDYLNAWFTAYDRQYSRYSPGNLLFMQEISDAINHGYRIMDFGAGEYDYKKYYSNDKIALHSGFIGGDNINTIIRKKMFDLRKKAENSKNEFVSSIMGKAMRKYDLIRSLRTMFMICLIA